MVTRATDEDLPRESALCGLPGEEQTGPVRQLLSGERPMAEQGLRGKEGALFRPLDLLAEACPNP